ncbi:unnamed protein product [Acanthocheilonema viteae]|uniref:Uncharacterized protein n=1 Tax=Acanthocheilonema viteae TaxID=6277 RepID=A0A498SKM8_ACAVI|nr:unnamed protein product [Acanthocheilonema viteae]
MAEVEDGRTIQVNGIDTEEMKTKIGEDDATLNDEPLNVENCQASEVALEEMRSDELNEVKEMDERAALEEQQEDELSTMVENNELNSMKIMEQAVGRVEVEDELDHKETDETGIDEEKIQMVADEGVEEQVVEDRTEDQVLLPFI